MAQATTQRPRRFYVDQKSKVCINCTHFRQYFREEPVPGETYTAMIPDCFGWCDRQSGRRSALRHPCKDFETSERRTS